MKKLLCLLMVLSLLLTAAGCGKKTDLRGDLSSGIQNAADAAAETAPVPSDTPDETSPSFDDQLQIMRGNSALWLTLGTEMEGQYWYAVADLNRNGYLEILKAHQLGYGHGHPISIYEVTPDGDLAALAMSSSGAELMTINPVTPLFIGYTGGGVTRYLVSDANGGPEGMNSFTYFMSLQDGEIVFEPFRGFGIAHNAFGGVTNYYYNSHWNEISEEAYNDLLGDAIPDSEYIGLTPGWYNADSDTNLEAFLSWSLAYSYSPWENQLEYEYSEAPDLKVYFDVLDGNYRTLTNVTELFCGYAEYSDDRIRFVAGRPNLTVSLESGRLLQTALYDWAFHADFTVFSFQPSAGAAYELPVLLTETIPACRLAVSDGVNTEYLYLLNHLDETELRCTEPQVYLTDPNEAIMGVCKAVAGWAQEAGNRRTSPQITGMWCPTPSA